MNEWWIAPQTAGAILVFQQNAYDFSAALLQPPKFDPSASDAATYGAIGAIIGHDVSHFVDVLGAEYDVDGAMRRWWTAEDSARFQSLAEPLVKQFSGYHPFPDARVDGKLTETENIADLAGLAAAFDAYRRTLGTRATDKELRAAAGPRVLHRLRAELAREAERRRACARSSPTITRRRCIASPPCAISTRGTTRSTCVPASGCTSRPRRACRIW